jgi:lipopolysaccharide export system protein LptC
MVVEKREKKSTASLLKRSKKHTGRVRILRRFLPIAALLSVLAVLLWSSFETFFEKKIDGIPDKARNIVTHNKVLNPRMNSTDSKGNPYKIEAENATQIEDSKAILEKPCCEIVGSKGQQIKLKSDTGLLNQEKQTFAYEGDVQLETDDGYVFETKKAKVDLKTQSVTGKDFIQGAGPAGNITAKDGFHVDKKSQELHFKGPTRLTINPKSTEKKETDQ